MKLFLRVLQFARPFRTLFILTFIVNGLYAATTAASIGLIKLLMLVFEVEGGAQPAPTGADTPGSEFLEPIVQGGFDAVFNMIYAESEMQTLLNLSLLIVGVFVVKNIFKYLGALVNVRLEEGVIKSIRDRLFKRMSALSMDYYSQRKSGTLISLVTNDVSQVNQSITPTLLSITREPIEAFIMLAILLGLSMKLTLIAFSTSIVSLLLIQLSTRYLRRYASRMQTAMADFTSVLQEMVGGIKIVKAFGLEKLSNERFTDQTSRYVHSAIKHRKVIALVPGINELFAIAALCAVLFVGGGEVFEDKMPASDLIAFLFYLFAIMSPISRMAQIPTRIQRGLVAAERVFATLDLTPKVKSGKEPIEKFDLALTIENLSFAYNDDTVLSEVNFKLERGRKIAFVGPSGGGKSTMANLLIRLYDPQEGAIKIDGRDIRSLKVGDYRGLFGVVAQEPTLFNDTVANNIRYGKPEATDAEIKHAAEIANAAEFIERLPQGYETPIGDRGTMLSGGQKQRLAIARALVRDPAILIFDEATSALDSESEKLVQDAINRVLRDRTAVLIAHRLSTIADADQILVFKGGRLVEQGNHAELLSKNGVYKNLCDVQFMGQV